MLSILAGQIDGTIEGTAPGADFMLFRTEDTGSEFPVEEDFWVAAAEYADSAGADIISSSLGYCILMILYSIINFPISTGTAHL